MRKTLIVLALAGGLAIAGPASAHGGGGFPLGAALVGAVVGVAVGSAITAPAYAAPAYYGAAPAYYEPPAYAEQGYAPVQVAAPACFDSYRQAYVPCRPPPRRAYYYGPAY
jgi:hypothetical protein